MAAKHLSNEEFFTKLTQLVDRTQQKGHGSVFLTQKRLTFDQAESKTPNAAALSADPLGDLHPAAPLPLLVRATDGNTQTADRKKSKNKVRLSTVVSPDDVEAFFTRYAEVCRASMQSLKKRDRSKRKKDRKKKDTKKTESTEVPTS